MQALAAGQAKDAEFGERAVDGEAGLLRELAPCRGEGILVRVGDALRHRPGGRILFRPIGTAGMDEEDLDLRAARR
ncbi:MAG: hypothetical protein WDM81_14730 [Rhizomicrobium sp.]